MRWSGWLMAAMLAIAGWAELGRTEAAEPASAAGYVRWEAEAAAPAGGSGLVATNFPKESPFSADTFPETRELLSGGDWLSIGEKPSGCDA